MDGSNVNWKLCDSIVEEQNENVDYPDLIDIGSCSLSRCAWSFQDWCAEEKWGIDSILQALYNLFS